MTPFPKPFPLPLVAIGPGSQPEEEESPAVLPMPRDMATFMPPPLPDPAALAAHGPALAALHAALAALRAVLAGEDAPPVDITALGDEDRALVNQVLGEGEVAAQVTGEDGAQVQESVFAGVWRVIHRRGDAVVRDTIEAGRIPRVVEDAARAAGAPMPALPDPLPAAVMNAPAVLGELRDHSAAWRPGTPSHVINLSLLPLVPADSELFEQVLGAGRVRLLSRGYGNCRVVDTGTSSIWRVTYFNSQDMILLDTLEVGAVPEVACAAREDLEDSEERLAEVLQWVEAS